MNRMVHFIVNARIGAKKTAAFTRALLTHFADVPHRVLTTAYGGHALVLTRESVEQQAAAVVAVGGDGTVNEVIQALAGKGIPMGIVPTGSGNGLARHAGIPLDIEQALALIRKGETHPIDLGLANERYFISNAGAGFDAWVCRQIRDSKLRGLPMYVRHVAFRFFRYKPLRFRITAGAQTFEETAWFANVANGREFGYGFSISPQASLDDGNLDLVLVRNITLLKGLRFVIDGWRGTLDKNSNCLHIRGRDFTISSEGMDTFQTDGDAHDCRGSCHIRIVPSALPLIMPKPQQP